jgi:hypothetical protein
LIVVLIAGTRRRFKLGLQWSLEKVIIQADQFAGNVIPVAKVQK